MAASVENASAEVVGRGGVRGLDAAGQAVLAPANVASCIVKAQGQF